MIKDGNLTFQELVISFFVLTALALGTRLITGIKKKRIKLELKRFGNGMKDVFNAYGLMMGMITLTIFIPLYSDVAFEFSEKIDPNNSISIGIILLTPAFLYISGIVWIIYIYIKIGKWNMFRYSEKEKEVIKEDKNNVRIRVNKYLPKMLKLKVGSTTQEIESARVIRNE